jgi:hypothetical protein
MSYCPKSKKSLLEQYPEASVFGFILSKKAAHLCNAVMSAPVNFAAGQLVILLLEENRRS